MNKAFVRTLAVVGAAAVPAFLLAPVRGAQARCAAFKGINYAHRGLHNEEKTVPENSLAAFRLAAQSGYGIELDVHLTKDSQVVVFHDDTLTRVCGVDGRIDDHTYLELQQFRLCGTQERIPLLSEVLANIDGAAALIVELKQGRDRETLCAKTLELLKAYRGPACIESFDPSYVAWFRRNAPKLVRGQLSMPCSEYGSALSRPKAYIASRCLLNALTRPDFIAYKIGRRPLAVRLSELMGAVKVGWTSLDAGDAAALDAVIFQFYTPEPRY